MDALSRSAEWRKHWPLVVGCFLGMSLSSAAIHTTALTIDPIREEFGWTRSEITLGISLTGIIAVLLSPFVGALIDRWGVRRIALPGVLLAGLGLSSMALANSSVALWTGLWLAYGLLALAIKPTVWTLAVASNFNASRALALSVTLTGTALSATIVPPLAQYLTDTFSWRFAYIGIGLGISLPCFLICFFFLYSLSDHKRRNASLSLHRSGENGSSDNSTTTPDLLPGLSVAEALRSVALYRIGLSTLIMLTLAGGLIVHKVSMLSEVGLDRQSAAWLASLTGLAAVAGKLVTGWLMEKFDTGLIGGITNGLTALALVLLLQDIRTPTLIVLAMITVGYANGTKLQICAHLTTVYGGLRNYGKIFGVMASAIALASGMGPFLVSLLHDYSGSYDLMIEIAIPASIVAGLLLIRLGKYPDWNELPKHQQAK